MAGCNHQLDIHLGGKGWGGGVIYGKSLHPFGVVIVMCQVCGDVMAATTFKFLFVMYITLPHIMMTSSLSEVIHH